MKWFLIAIIFSSGGQSVYYEKRYAMPDFEACERATKSVFSDIKLEAGAKRSNRAGVVLFCAMIDE
jgi:hypothetical protein